MDSFEAQRLLGLGMDGGFSAIELKKAFRTRSFTCHPDAGGSSEEFQKLQEAYRTLEPWATQEEGTKEQQTVDGTALSALGHGYPLTESARPCDGCDGHGYREMHEPTGHIDGECDACGGTGLVRHPCNRCNGTGDYKHPKTGKVVGECYSCRGDGWFYPYRKKRAGRRDFQAFWEAFHVKYIPGTTKIGQNCMTCLGSGTREVPTGERTFYVVCSSCEGVGEVKMWNPVLPRGFFKAKGDRR